MMRRALWIVATPVVYALNRAGVLGYKWVNVCAGARRRDWFDALYHHEWFGDPIADLPETVNLCGIEYSAACSEGLVTFRCHVFGSRISFHADPYQPHPTQWTVEVAGAHVPACHVDKAWRWVVAVYGDTFTPRRAPLAALGGAR